MAKKSVSQPEMLVTGTIYPIAAWKTVGQRGDAEVLFPDGSWHRLPPGHLEFQGLASQRPNRVQVEKGISIIS